MPAPKAQIPVAGTVSGDTETAHFVLTERLTGHSTFLSGELQLDHQRIPVRILTLDDMTVLRPTRPLSGHRPGSSWSGTLHLPHGLRAPAVPHDLNRALAAAGIDAGSVEPPELRHLITYLREATTPAVRQHRITAIVSALSHTTA